MDHGIVRVVNGGWLDGLTRYAVTRPDTSTILWETLYEPWDLFTRLDKGDDVTAAEPVTLLRDVCSGHDSSEKNCSVICTSSDDLFASWKTLWQCLSLSSLTLANSTFSTLDQHRGGVGNGTSREQISSALASFGITNATDFDGKAVLNLTYECAAASCRDTSMGECSIGQLNPGYFESETIQWIKVYEALAPLCDGLESDINIDITGPGVLITYITQTAMVVFAWLFFLLLKVNKFINTSTSIFTHLFRKRNPGPNLLTHRVSGLERLERTNLAHATSIFLAELHEAQCFFVVAIEIALINASSRSAIFTGAENWQSLLWNRDSVQFLAGMGAWPIILGQISLRRAELDSMYYLLLSTLALVLAGVAADTAANPDPDRIYKMFQGQNTLQECGGNPSLRTFYVEEREGLYCPDLSAVYNDKITLKSNAQTHNIVDQSSILRGTRWKLTRSKEEYEFYTKDQLKQSSKDCHLCSLLWHSSFGSQTTPASRACPGESIAQKPDVNTPLLPAIPRPCSSGDCEQGVKSRNLSVQVSATRDFGRRQSLRIRLYEKRSSLFPWLKVQDASYAPYKHNCWQFNTTGSEASFLWAREIVDKCEREHHNCCNHFIRSTSQRYLPKRLIDVQSRGQGAIQLVLSKTLESDRTVEYAALSHCWGTTVKSELRKDSEETMKTIMIETLDPSFRDAVDITYRMGIKYLWIDSLCIMQRTEEWEEESGDMGLVYARAKFVISATASKNSDGGCYQPRDLYPYDCVLCANWTSALVVRSRIRYPDLVHLFGERVDRSFLATRGWTFQERFLASRILHFCSGLLMFECNTLTTSECHREEEYPLIAHFTQDGTLNLPKVPDPGREPPKQLCSSKSVQHSGSSTRPFNRPANNTVEESWYANPKHELWAEWKQLYDVQMSSLRTNAARLSIRGAFSFLWSFRGQDMKEKAEFHLRWYEMVTSYSIRNLTNDSDKMMAIAGVAYFIQQSTGFTYAAGLWEETLPFNLLWVAEPGVKRRPSGRSVPSWSWASVDGKISHHLKKIGPAFSSGSRISLTVDGSSGSNSWDYIQSLISDLEVRATHIVNGMALNVTLRLSCQLLAFSLSSSGYVYDTLEHHERGEIRCLPIFEFGNHIFGTSTKTSQIQGILVRAASSTSSQGEGTWAQYKRVGYFCTEKTNIHFQETGREGRRSIELI
ncbi:tol [Fusarium tjaetaba]|uniref:Tol n=1 Tax=Fusarium tjaetaba TaxID=1567544 RepID=A0A8H5S468_9HYPO|nr:tol [Fusarium tjaetaba]KAF5643551.1 tol [Fusarium tjaetaba]